MGSATPSLPLRHIQEYRVGGRRGLGIKVKNVILSWVNHEEFFFKTNWRCYFDTFFYKNPCRSYSDIFTASLPAAEMTPVDKLILKIVKV